MSARYPIIDPTQLSTMEVLETIDTETILAERMARFKAVWMQHDPPLGAEYDVDGLEFDPIKITQEASTYFELMLRDRINQAARATTLIYGFGTNLDAIASRYPGGVPRLPGETDDRYRHRIWLSPGALAAHGTKEGYEFWALTADATLKDAVAIAVEGTAEITLTVMASGADPIPTDAQLLAVRAYIHDEGRKGETDVVSVAAPVIIPIEYNIEYRLYPGIDQPSTEAAIIASLRSLIANQYWIGVDHARSAIDKAAHLDGVHSVRIVTPTVDVPISKRQVGQVTALNVRFMGRAE